uniref:TIL domain-containing protein n=1 Tax=Anopheles atroparvus TaxID=41427 RepID=A0AAG5D0Q7_ANOAO
MRCDEYTTAKRPYGIHRTSVLFMRRSFCKAYVNCSRGLVCCFNMVSTAGFLVLFAALLIASADAQCPPYSEFTTNAPCDFVCGVPCDYKGVKNICICMEGYLKDRSTGQCVLENQCPETVSPDTPTLRGSVNSFSFSCFS